MSAPTEAELEDMLTQLESISESLLGIVDDIDWAHIRVVAIQRHLFPDTSTEKPDG